MKTPGFLQVICINYPHDYNYYNCYGPLNYARDYLGEPAPER